VGIPEALHDIDIAFFQLEFTIKLLSFCELGNIDPANFDTDHIVKLERGNLHFPTGHFSSVDNIIRAASVSVLIAFSATALVLDKAFEVSGIRPEPEAIDKVGQLRTLIYMVRCAQAHGVAEPRWEVRGKFLRRIAVDIDGISLSLDLRTLHGELFNIDDIGGYENWYRLRDAAVRVLSQPSSVSGDRTPI
jgi:hypothetical protein